MESRLPDQPRIALQILLWYSVVMVVFWIVMGIREVLLTGESVVGLFFMTLVLCYYASVWLVGRVMLKYGKPERAWLYVAAIVVLAFGPAVWFWQW